MTFIKVVCSYFHDFDQRFHIGTVVKETSVRWKILNKFLFGKFADFDQITDIDTSVKGIGQKQLILNILVFNYLN